LSSAAQLKSFHSLRLLVHVPVESVAAQAARAKTLHQTKASTAQELIALYHAYLTALGQPHTVKQSSVEILLSSLPAVNQLPAPLPCTSTNQNHWSQPLHIPLLLLPLLPHLRSLLHLLLLGLRSPLKPVQVVNTTFLVLHLVLLHCLRSRRRTDVCKATSNKKKDSPLGKTPCAGSGSFRAGMPARCRCCVAPVSPGHPRPCASPLPNRHTHVEAQVSTHDSKVRRGGSGVSSWVSSSPRLSALGS
jgi:hypothetical protein